MHYIVYYLVQCCLVHPMDIVILNRMTNYFVYFLAPTHRPMVVQFLYNDTDLCKLRLFSIDNRIHNDPMILIHFDFVNPANATNGNR